MNILFKLTKEWLAIGFLSLSITSALSQDQIFWFTSGSPWDVDGGDRLTWDQFETAASANLHDPLYEHIPCVSHPFNDGYAEYYGIYCYLFSPNTSGSTSNGVAMFDVGNWATNSLDVYAVIKLTYSDNWGQLLGL